jgi:hypothetical protein
MQKMWRRKRKKKKKPFLLCLDHIRMESRNGCTDAQKKKKGSCMDELINKSFC